MSPTEKGTGLLTCGRMFRNAENRRNRLAQHPEQTLRGAGYISRGRRRICVTDLSDDGHFVDRIPVCMARGGNILGFRDLGATLPPTITRAQ